MNAHKSSNSKVVYLHIIMLHKGKPVSGLQLTFGSNMCFSTFVAIRVAHSSGSDYFRDSLSESMALHVEI